MVVAVDVHDRWQLEQALRASEARMQQLNTLHLDLVSTVECTLRAPLTVLVGNLELLRLLRRMLEAEQRQALLEAEREALWLQRLVQDLLTLARHGMPP